MQDSVHFAFAGYRLRTAGWLSRVLRWEVSQRTSLGLEHVSEDRRRRERRILQDEHKENTWQAKGRSELLPSRLR